MTSVQRSGESSYDAVVVGSGPNGLAAAITLAQAGRAVIVLEAKETLGGGLRTEELTLPGFRHDVCAAVHPLAMVSPFFKSLDLSAYGLEWIHPPLPLAHPLDGEEAVLLKPSLKATADGLGPDASAYLKLIGPALENADKIVPELLKPLGIPKHPFAMRHFAPVAMRSAAGLAASRFRDKRARALFAGNAAHSILPLDRSSSAAFGMMLSMLGHAVGWPIARGGSQKIADALSACLQSSGGELKTSVPVSSMSDMPKARVYLFDITPRQLARIAGLHFSDTYRRRLERHAHGPGVFKIDWALSESIPWSDPQCLDAGTLHLGGTLEEIARSEADTGRGIAPEKPFVLLSQPSLFDSTRAPDGKHTAWAYCHVPNGCEVDMTDRIEDQVERFAPGFRNCISARHTMSPADMEAHNPNYIGGDIVGGSQSFRELFILPLGRLRAYATPLDGVYICSSSMPPGGGVHGMCGHLAGKLALHNNL
jgi:phytoene dehydrogenase-like protein